MAEDCESSSAAEEEEVEDDDAVKAGLPDDPDHGLFGDVVCRRW